MRNEGDYMDGALIQIEHLYKIFKNEGHSRSGSVPVLADINLIVERGDFYILLGSSGCGKSTLLNIIAGFLTKTSGKVLVKGKEVVKPGRDRGVVFQNADSAIFSWLTARENVEFGLKMQGIKKEQRNTISEEYLQLVGLSTHADKYPHELSGGMKQRVQLARLLANDSEILIMDEPFGALDAQTRKIMQRELIRIWQKTNKTIVFVTHDIQEAVLLGKKVSVLASAPLSGIAKTYSIDFPYPRNETDSAFIQQYMQLLGHFDFGGGI
jgi:NitT/TauT family transport system ATP-binding protein